jgi:hypothetical protein
MRAVSPRQRTFGFFRFMAPWTNTIVQHDFYHLRPPCITVQGRDRMPSATFRRH